ncbi:MAG TPA: protein kinase [Nannocystis sp.]|jgi:serine/threonine-protein kinase
MQRIGVGGFGAVYQAEHVVTRRNFAIKVLLPEFSERPKFAERFVREATTTARIEHENVVDIIDVGRTDQGHLYFAMELLRGETLERTLARDGRLSWQRARTITLQICDGLRAAHDRGIIHRDLKPANIYRVTRGGNPDFIKILDFGIAKLLAPEDQKAGKGLTSHYEVLGTPLYMSPEQTAADPVDRRSDIYSVGVMLFEMLTGERPYAGESHVELMSKILLGEVPQMAEVAPHIDIPPAFQTIVSKAMARKAAQRYFDMNAMMAALQSLDERGNFTADSGSATAVRSIAAASEDTMLAASSKDEVARTLIRPPAPRSAGPGRPLLAAGLILVGLVTVGAASLLMIGGGPEEQALPPSVERVPLPLTPENRLIVAPDQMPPIPSFIVEAPRTPPRSTRPAPACEAALSSILGSLPAATVRKCIANTGVTSGDRTKVQLAGSAGGKVEVKTLESSGSREFDACLARALGQRHLPAETAPSRCQKALPYRVP